ncbi:DUF2812 domain-containing protein [Clostridium sp. CF012]|uniref:DUF2812 domain-containing protein n=1 Tax=Clostridium sp. CF012 TaxID=2843319 RepID=UPI001C0DEFAD|nr:DUF2812 domain-containing protein [Clostridium sp. CF012]MBU3146018.1 DUF2812 domain-containing protein [Clostridium sp. CF012]
MRSKDTKRTYFMYLPYECSAVEEYLDGMAEKGWLLQSVKRGFFKFKKVEIRKIKYSVDILDRVSVFDHNDSDVALEYREYCEAAGWTYVCEDGKIQIFYTEGDKEIRSIHTDEEERFKIVFKSSIKIVYGQMILISLFIMSMYLQLTDSSEILLATNIGAFSLALVFSCILMNLIEIINFNIWVVKAKSQLRKKKLMIYNSYKQLNRKNTLIKTYYLILVIILIIALVFDIPGSIKFNMPMALIMLVAIIILSNVKKFTDKKDYTKDSNMGIYIGCTLVTLLVVFVLSNAFGNMDNTKQGVVSAEKAGLTLMDFGYELNEDKNSYDYKNSYIEFDKSILAQRTKYSYKSGGNSLEYTMFESKYPWLIKLDENRVVSRYKKFLKFKQGKTNLPSNIRVYFGVNSNFLILVSEDKVIFIAKNLSVYEDEFLNMAYKKLLSQ